MTMLLEQLRSLRLTSGDHFHALALAPATPQGYPASQCLVASSDVPVGHPIDEFSAEELAAIDQDPLLQSGPDTRRSRCRWVRVTASTTPRAGREVS